LPCCAGSFEGEVRVDDRFRLVVQQPRRPKVVGQVVAGRGELRGKALISASR